MVGASRSSLRCADGSFCWLISWKRFFRQLAGLIGGDPAVLLQGQTALSAGRAVSDDVALDAARLDPDTEARELLVPVLGLFRAGGNTVHER
jgi:hypothetical protein